MSSLDWIVLGLTIAAILLFGLWKERGGTTAEKYISGGRDMKWHTVGLSVMATQASAITFLSMPGQAYLDGMGFIQFYFGLPVAMVILSSVMLPMYSKLKVKTAYEYLENRFDQKTRQLTAFLFLLSRGLASGISILAPAIVLSVVFSWPLRGTTLGLGAFVILYTVIGGTRLVSRTQTYQMVVMLGGMIVAAVVVFSKLPADVSLIRFFQLAGHFDKLKTVDFSLRLDTRYTFWSGMTGGLFVNLAYFGTDQSQVQRYLTGASLKESRLGLLFNALLKIPMQALILLVGILVFVFYQFEKAPVYFDVAQWQAVSAGANANSASQIETAWAQNFELKNHSTQALLQALETGRDTDIAAHTEGLKKIAIQSTAIRNEARNLIARSGGAGEKKDSDFIFLYFVLSQFPKGLVGLLVAVILSAAMSSTAAALNSLGSTSVVDFYKRSTRPQADDAESLLAARGFTIFWGLLAVLFAIFASSQDNLIQAVNVLGSIFYGPMLGVFLLGFLFKQVRGTAAFGATLFAQAVVITVWLTSSIGFLWYNVIGCGVVMAVALLTQQMLNRGST
jgi:SSS family transporter